MNFAKNSHDVYGAVRLAAVRAHGRNRNCYARAPSVVREPLRVSSPPLSPPVVQARGMWQLLGRDRECPFAAALTLFKSLRPNRRRWLRTPPPPIPLPSPVPAPPGRPRRNGGELCLARAPIARRICRNATRLVPIYSKTESPGKPKSETFFQSFVQSAVKVNRKTICVGEEENELRLTLRLDRIIRLLRVDNIYKLRWPSITRSSKLRNA